MCPHCMLNICKHDVLTHNVITLSRLHCIFFMYLELLNFSLHLFVCMNINSAINICDFSVYYIYRFKKESFLNYIKMIT